MFSVLAPKGLIAAQESALIVQASLLMAIVVLPVLFLLFFFAWRYRASNPKAAYRPHWRHGRLDELIWWAVPLEIILVLGALAWHSSHTLDPHRAIASSTPALRVEVVALPWKWLFIYPDLGIATVNFVEIPSNVPINFSITADAPMNSFWVPELGGQMYAMTGMVTPLSLMADEPGDYQGMSANYSGEGFSDMRFVVRAATSTDFEAWVASTHRATSALTTAQYTTLAEPGTTAVAYYGSVAPTLFDSIVAKFNGPAGPTHDHAW